MTNYNSKFNKQLKLRKDQLQKTKFKNHKVVDLFLKRRQQLFSQESKMDEVTYQNHVDVLNHNLHFLKFVKSSIKEFPELEKIIQSL